MFKPILFTMILVLSSMISHTGFASKPLLFLTSEDAEQIQSIMNEGKSIVPSLIVRLKNLAEKQVTLGPWSVTFHPSPAASGNPHDFYSEEPYWWPDPKIPMALISAAMES